MAHRPIWPSVYPGSSNFMTKVEKWGPPCPIATFLTQKWHAIQNLIIYHWLQEIPSTCFIPSATVYWQIILLLTCISHVSVLHLHAVKFNVNVMQFKRFDIEICANYI